jgi:hypothetical protein
VDELARTAAPQAEPQTLELDQTAGIPVGGVRVDAPRRRDTRACGVSPKADNTINISEHGVVTFTFSEAMDTSKTVLAAGDVTLVNGKSGLHSLPDGNLTPAECVL